MTQVDFDFDTAEASRDEGIARAVARAEANSPQWSARALGLLRHFVELHKGTTFLAENFVEWVEKTYPLSFPKPPDPRAYGGVIRAAAKLNMIEKVGYAPAKTSNCSPKCQWRGL